MTKRDDIEHRLARIEERLDQLAADCRRLDDAQRIREVLFRYCRALDRLDGELLRTTMWPEAHVDLGAGLYQGPACEFFDFALQFQGAMRVTRHEIANVLLEPMAEERAFAESYVRAFHVVEAGGRLEDLVVYGRYLDHFERRGTEWRIARRTEVLDWAHERPATADWFDRQPPLHRGAHDGTDALYRERQLRAAGRDTGK